MLKFFFKFLFLIVLAKTTQASSGSQTACQTDDCKKSAKNLKSCMNESVDPCENFYQYACGNFNSTLSEKDEATDFFSLVSNKIKKSVEEILIERKKHPSKAVETAKELYRLCLDTETMNNKGLTPLMEILQKIGLSTQSPLSKPSKYFDWVTAAAKQKKLLNLDFFIAIDVSPDVKNRTINRISVTKPVFSGNFGPDYSDYLRLKLKNSKKRSKSLSSSDDSEDPGEEIYEYIRGVSNVLDRSRRKRNKSEKKKLRKAVNKLASFIIERLNLGLRYESQPADTLVAKLMTVDELQNYTDSALNGFYDGKLILDWKKYINTLFEDTDVNLDLDNGTDKISVSDMMYLRDAVLLIEKNHNILESGLWWDVIQNFGPFTTDELRDFDVKFRENTEDATTDNSDLCQGVVRKHFSFALAHVFLDNPEATEYQNKTEDMLKNLVISFDRILSKVQWMDDETKKIAREKIMAMKKYISHPDWLYNISEVDEYHENLKIYPNDFLRTILLFEQTTVKDSLNSLRNVNDLEDDTYDSHPLVTNAFYFSTYNTMIVPMGIIQFPFTGHSIQAMNYGSLGTIIGHEITHGFDTEGRLHDQVGNIRRWWKNYTLAEYKNRASCFVKSYNEIEIGGDNVDGILTLDENIADNGGFRGALLAYRNYVITNGLESSLTGMEGFNHEQLFTLSFANAWCESSSEIDSSDKHSPEEARVVGVLRNSPEFQEIWKCKIGSPMNPNKKCLIW